MQAKAIREERSASWPAGGWAWLTAGSLAAVCLLLGSPAYLISDDVGIARNLENGFEAPFISMLLGQGLRLIYLIIPPVPWYGLMLYAAHLVSLGLGLFVLGKIAALRRLLVPCVLLYALVYAGYLLRVSFSSVSLMLGFNALLAWLVLDKPARSLTVFGLGIALACSYLIRVDGFYLMLLLGLPLAIRGIARKNRSLRGLLFLAPVAVVLLLNTLWIPRRVPADYRSYARYNLARGRFMDFPMAQANTNNVALMQAVGWSANDYRALTHWFFLDEDVFSRERLQEVVRRTDLARPAPPAYGWHILREFVSQYSDHAGLLALALFAAVAVSDRRRRWGQAGYAAYIMGLLLGVALWYRLPPRVGSPAFLAAATGLLSLARFGSETPDRAGSPCWRGIQWLLAGVLAVTWTARIIRWEAENRDARRQLDQSAEVLREFPADTLFVAEPAIALHFEAMSPWSLRRSYPENVLPGGWAIGSPLFYNLLKKHGLLRAADVLPHSIDNPAILFIIFNEDFGGIITTWLREHALREVRMERVRELPGGRAVYQVVSAGR